MLAADLVKSVFREACPANLANAAKPRMNIGPVPITNPCEPLRIPTRQATPAPQIRNSSQDVASPADSADTGVSQHSQDSQRGIVESSIADLLARYGDASAGGVDWAKCRIASVAQSARHWLVLLRAGGMTTLQCSRPTTRAELLNGLRYGLVVALNEPEDWHG